MTDLDELLQREGRRWQAGFQPPRLEAMLATATRPAASRARWAWPILAAVLLLVVPLITVLLRHPTPAVHRPGTPAAGLKLYGSVPWVKVVSQPDGHSVSVYVDVDKTPNLACLMELPVLQATAVETGTRITIRVQAYPPADYRVSTVAPGTVFGCAGVGHSPVPVLVVLAGPIAGRSLVDASTGAAYPVVQAADLPSLTKLPTGYLDAGSSPAQAVDQLPGFADHTYRNGDQVLKLIRGRAGSLPRYAVDPVEATGTVLGRPARVGGRPDRCVVWSDHSYSWQLCSASLEPALAQLSAAELLTIANSMR